MDWKQNQPLSLKANISTDSTDPACKVISAYEWTVNNVNANNNKDVLVIDTSRVGKQTVTARAQNSGGWSPVDSIDVNITSEVIMVSMPITIDKPVMSVTIQRQNTSTVTVTVVDETNKPIPNIQVQIAGISGNSDATGKVTLPNVPMGNQQISAPFPFKLTYT